MIFNADDSEMPASWTHCANNVSQSSQRRDGTKFHRQQQRERRDVHLGSSRREVSRGGEAQQRSHADAALRVRGWRGR